MDWWPLSCTLFIGPWRAGSWHESTRHLCSMVDLSSSADGTHDYLSADSCSRDTHERRCRHVLRVVPCRVLYVYFMSRCTATEPDWMLALHLTSVVHVTVRAADGPPYCIGLRSQMFRHAPHRMRTLQYGSDRQEDVTGRVTDSHTGVEQRRTAGETASRSNCGSQTLDRTGSHITADGSLAWVAKKIHS